MDKEEILKKVIASSEELVNKYRKNYAAMLAAGWRGDIPTRDVHRKVIEEMWPQIQATVGRIFNWAVAQLKPRYTGGAVAYGRGRGRVCAASSYAAPISWVDGVEANAVVGAPSWKTYSSKEEALSATVASIGNGNTLKVKVRDRPDPNDAWYSMTTVIETKNKKSLDEAIEAADPKWGLTGFGQWKWNGEEISSEEQAEVLLLQGESPFRGRYAHGKLEFDIAVM